jgi:hypothetical protein
MSQRSQLKALDEVMLFAVTYAQLALCETGELGAAFVFLTPNDSVLILPVDTSDDRVKNFSEKLARVACIAHAATGVVFVGGAWMSRQPAVLIPPSEASDRQEIVIITGEAYGGAKQKVLPIIRDWSGRFCDFGGGLPLKRGEGRFTNILPCELPTPQVQAEAKQLLSRLAMDEKMKIVSEGGQFR